MYCTSARTLLPWKIAECALPTFTFKQFYEEKVGSEFKSEQRTMPFSPCVQHVKDADTMVQCEECEMWRLVYSKYKLTTAERATLNQALEEFTFTCGAVLSDLVLVEERLDREHVFVRSLRCYEPLEKLYYSGGSYEHMCIYCCSSENISQMLTV